MTIFQFNRKYCLILYTIYVFDDFDLIYVYVQVFFLIMKTFDVTWFAAIVLLHTGPVLSQLFNPQNSGQGLSPNGRLDISQFILTGNKIYPSVSLNIYIIIKCLIDYDFYHKIQLYEAFSTSFIHLSSLVFYLPLFTLVLFPIRLLSCI